MASVRHFGQPDLFITFTANLKWAKIEHALKDFPEGKAEDHLDIVAWVFHIKQKQLVEELKHDHIFGQFREYVWTVEYQKRGLSHMHLLLFLEPGHHYTKLYQIDQIISIEFPNPDMDLDRSLTDIVTIQIVHSSCGVFESKSPCMMMDNSSREISCSKRYPQTFQEQTIVEEDGYLKY